MTDAFDPTSLLQTLPNVITLKAEGRVHVVTPSTLIASLPLAALGDVVTFVVQGQMRLARVVAVEDEGRVVLSPLDAARGARAGSRVRRVAKGLPSRLVPACVVG